MRIFFLLLLCAYTTTVFAQPNILSGRVVSTRGTPVESASVYLQGTTNRTITNKEGTFSLAYQQLPITLSISHVGYATQIMSVTTGEAIRIILQDSSSELDGVIVQAYGTTTRRYATGNIGKVTAAEIEKQPVTNPLAALQGRVPGVVITQSSGVPGSSFTIEIRGRSSLDQALSRNDPLFVIDNVPFEPGNLPTNQLASAANTPTNITKGGLSPMNSINPSDIESIEVLKDADATAIYGSRGANGVILITTKQGRAGKAKLNLSLSSGISKIAHMTDMLTTQQYVQMRREAFANDGIVPTTANAGDLLLWDTTRYTDMKKLLIGNTARFDAVQGSLSGGNANTQFSVGGGYNRQTNVYSNDLSDQVRSARFTIAHTSTDRKLKLNLSAIYASDINKLLTIDLTQYLNLPPNIKLADAAGNLNWGENGLNFDYYNLLNPLALLRRRYTSTNDNLSGNLSLQYQLLPGLSLRASLGYNTYTSNELAIYPKAALAPYLTGTASSSFAGGTSKSYIIEPQAEYRREIGAGQLTVLVGTTLQNRSNSSYQISASNYTSDLLLESVAAAGTLTASNKAEQYRYNAIFGRVNYQFKNTYILNLSGRRDGSSRFGPDKQFANFGAAGAAWIFSNYSFFKTKVPFLSFGKLRGSYGITGNDQIGNYKYLNLWSSTPYAYTGIPGLYPASLFNPDYAWEINKKGELAIDLGFLADRILFSTAYYRNRCSNQLINYKLPTQTGFDAIGKNLSALVQNTGVEILLSGLPIKAKNVSWNASLNLTFPRNKLVSFPGLALSSYAATYTEGQSLTQIQAYEYLGVNPETGVYAFRDMDGNGIINSKDKRLFGNTDPKYYGGLQNTVSYKGLELSIFFEFRKQIGRSYQDQLNTTIPGIIGFNQPVLVLDRWRQKGDNAPTQRFTTSYTSAAANASLTQFNLSSGLYTDASYIRCKNVAISYTIPASIIRRAHLETFRLFLQAQNLFAVTSYKGSDPETQNFFVLPPLRTFVGGIQINL